MKKSKIFDDTFLLNFYYEEILNYCRYIHKGIVDEYGRELPNESLRFKYRLR